MTNVPNPNVSEAFANLQDHLHLTERALDQVRFHLQAEEPDLAEGALAEARLHWANAHEAIGVEPGLLPDERDNAVAGLEVMRQRIEAWAGKIAGEPTDEPTAE